MGYSVILQGLEASPGQTLTFAASVTYPANNGIMALGLGSVFGGPTGVALGYFSGTDPFTCTPTGCAYASGTGNSSASKGKICEVTFDVGLCGTNTGSGSYAVVVDASATAGDYLLGYSFNTGGTSSPPRFYLRVGNVR